MTVSINRKHTKKIWGLDEGFRKFEGVHKQPFPPPESLFLPDPNYNHGKSFAIPLSTNFIINNANFSMQNNMLKSCYIKVDKIIPSKFTSYMSV